MGKIIKNHWARLVVLVAAAIQIGGSIEGFFWPKVTWDFSTPTFNILVKPCPILQIVNLLLGLIVLAWEWPLCFLAGTMFHRSIHARLVVYAICAVTSIFAYQAHSSTIYYLLGLYGYSLALSSREIIYAEPWTVPAVDEVPAFSKPYLDPEQGLKDYFSQISEFSLEKHMEDISTPTLESKSEEPKRATKISLEKESPQQSTRGPKYIPHLKLTPISHSPIDWPTTRFQSPTVKEVGYLFELNRSNKDSSNPYKRMRARTWHHEALDDQD